MTEEIKENKTGLPKDWKWVKVSSVADLYRGINYTKDVASNNPFKEGLPILRGNNINGELNFDGLVYVPQSLIKKEQFIKKDDIIFAMSSGSKHLVGKSAVAKSDFNGSYGAFCALLRISDDVNKKYVSFIFKGNSYRKLISEIAKGTNINNLKREHILDFELPLPPNPIQQAIVSKIEELFSELDKGIEQLKTAQQQLKTYRQSVLKWAFEGKLTNSLNYDSFDLDDEHDLNIAAEGEAEYKIKKNQGNQNNQINHSSDKGELPKGWKWSSLKELKQFSLYGPRFSSKDYTEHGIAVLRTTDISERGKVDWENSPKLNLSIAAYEKYKLVKNDLLITRTGSIGRLSIFNDDNKAIPGAFLIHYRLDENVNIWYVFHFLKSHKAQKHFSEHSSGIGRPNLNVPNIELLKIPVPAIQEQGKIVQEIESRLSVADKMEESIIQSLQQAEALRQSILKRAFEGNLI